MIEILETSEKLEDAFLLAMRGFASSVGIVTAAHNGERYAMTLTSAMSLSIEPLSVVVAVNRSVTIHKALSEGVGY